MNWLLLILKLLPSILQAVKTVEEVAPGLTGDKKKALIVDSIVNPPVGQVAPTPAMLDVVKILIDSSVKSLNDSGVFTKTKK